MEVFWSGILGRVAGAGGRGGLVGTALSRAPLGPRQSVRGDTGTTGQVNKAVFDNM